VYYIKIISIIILVVNLCLQSFGRGLYYKRMESLNEAGLIPLLIENIEASGFSKPYVVQKACIPIIMRKRDLITFADNQTGKTVHLLPFALS